jgi:hypothetical protein
MPDLNKIQKNVLDVITRTPEAANDDALLLERYYIEIDGWDDSKSLYWNLQRVTRAGTITRRRRELYNLGLIEYSPEALKARTKAYKRERDVHSYFENTKAQIVQPKTYVTWVDGELVTVIE